MLTFTFYRLNHLVWPVGNSMTFTLIEVLKYENMNLQLKNGRLEILLGVFSLFKEIGLVSAY